MLLAVVSIPSPATSQASWERVPGSASDLAVASDGTVWAIGAGNANKVGGGYRIFRSGPANVQWAPVPGAALRIAVEGQSPWVVNDAGRIFRWDGRQWQSVNGPKAVDVGASAKGVWITAEPRQGANYTIYKWTGRDWAKADGAAVRVDVDSSGNPWVVNAVGEVFAKVTDRWMRFRSEPAVDISVDTFGEPSIVVKNGALQRYDSKAKKWENAGAGVLTIAERGGQVWQINAKLEISRARLSAASSNAGTQAAASPPADAIQAPKPGSVVTPRSANNPLIQSPANNPLVQSPGTVTTPRPAPSATIPQTSAPDPASASPPAQQTAQAPAAPRPQDSVQPAAGRWDRVPGTASDIAIASDGTIWAIGAGNANKVGGGYRIFRSGPSNVQWTPVPGAAVRIAVEGQSPWVANDAGRIFRWDGRQWQSVGGPKAVDVGASAKGVWLIAEPRQGDNYTIYRWTGRDWARSAGAAVRVDVDSSGNPWVVNAAGQVFAFANNKWMQFQSEPAADISIDVFGEPYVVAKTGSLMRYDSKLKKWEKTADGVTAVAQRGSMLLQLNVRQELARGAHVAATATGPAALAPSTTIPSQNQSASRSPAASPTVAQPPSRTTAAPTRTTTAPAGSASTTLSTTPLSVTTTTLPTTLSVTNPTTTNPSTNLSTMSPLSIMGTLNTDGAPISTPGGGPQLTVVTPVVLPRPMSKGKLACPIVGGTPARMQAPCEGTAAPLFLADAPGVECPSGGFFDPRKGGECWSCPSGFVRTLHAVDRSDACTKGEELSRATLIRHEICPANTFRDGSNCWSCPSGFSRTWDPVTAERACSQSWSGPFARATNHGAAHSGCPADSFRDPRNGGECWSCPAGFDRSLAPVTEFNACSKVIHREYRSATFVSRSKCGSVRTAPGYGAPFFDARKGGKCWACPVGHTRNVWAVDSEAQVKGCSRYFIWDTPQYPEPGIYALARPELLRLALGDPKRLRAYVSKRAKGQPNVEREILAKMVRTPGDSPELKALMFAAILSDKGIPHAAPFQQYIFDRRAYVINEALAMYDSWKGIDAYQMSQAVRRSQGTLTGNDPSGMQTGVVGSAPPDILAYAWSSALPDAAGGATLDAVYTLSGMANAGELGPLTDTAAFFDPIYLAPIFKALDKAVDGMGDWVKNAATWTSQVNRHMAFLGANFALALVQYSVDLYTVIAALVAIEETKQAIDEAREAARMPVSLREMIKTDEGRSQMLLYWALFSSPYSGGAKIGQGALSDADSCKRAVAFAAGHSPCEIMKQHVANAIRAAGYDQNLLSQVFR